MVVSASGAKEVESRSVDKWAVGDLRGGGAAGNFGVGGGVELV
jgi:hypothetical protein